jgi:hypothetical protein
MEKETGKFQPLNKFKELLKRVVVRKSEKESENIAREAVLLFANNTNQEPQQTFSANSPSEFDLTKVHEGTIFRIVINDKDDGGKWNEWYVTGKTNGKKPDVFKIISRQINRDESVNKLSLKKDWYIKRTPVDINSFPVKIALQTLNNWMKNTNSTVKQIDIMSSGLKRKIEEKKDARQILSKLKLATQTI